MIDGMIGNPYAPFADTMSKLIMGVNPDTGRGLDFAIPEFQKTETAVINHALANEHWWSGHGGRW